jgi:hypothetical protein
MWHAAKISVATTSERRLGSDDFVEWLAQVSGHETEAGPLC